MYGLGVGLGLEGIDLGLQISQARVCGSGGCITYTNYLF